MYALKKEGSRAGGFDLGGYYNAAVLEVWPENWPAYEIFSQLMTQWHVGMGGRTGLIYQSVFELIDRKGYKNEDWWQVFEGIRVMEIAALETMRQD